MNFEEIEKAIQLAGDFDFQIATIGMVGESGEFANLVKKHFRDKIDNKSNMRLEIADIQIYLIVLAKYLGFNLVEAVLDKLEINESKRINKNFEYILKIDWEIKNE